MAARGGDSIYSLNPSYYVHQSVYNSQKMHPLVMTCLVNRLMLELPIPNNLVVQILKCM